jgi:hypothetical protein
VEELLDAATALVEVSDNDGIAYAITPVAVAVAVAELLFLRHEPKAD